MAELIIPPGYAHLAWRVVNNTVGHTCIFTIGAKLAPGIWTGAMRTELYNDVSAALAPMWDPAVTMTGFHALIGNDGPPMAADVTGGVTGTLGTTTMAPPNVSYLAKKVTAFAGRSFRGRLYLPFVDATFLSENGRISGTTLSRFGTAMVGLQNAALSSAGGGLDGWYLLHRAGTPGGAEGPTLITDILSTNVVATQRRRLER